jgi:uncharacterized membrane protein
MATTMSTNDVDTSDERGLARPLIRKPAKRTKNIGEMERLGSSLAGMALIATSLRKRSLIGVGASVVSGAGLLYRGISGYCGLYAALGIDRSQQHSHNLGVPAKRGVKVDTAVVINRPAAELYQYWRDFENIPNILDHITAVIQLDEKHSRWIAQGPLDQLIEWQAEILTERENELIAWRSLPDSNLNTAGSIRFEQLPAERGTAVTLSLKYDPSGGKVASLIASLLGHDPEQELKGALRRFKQLMEAGEFPSVGDQPQRTCGSCADQSKG